MYQGFILTCLVLDLWQQQAARWWRKRTDYLTVTRPYIETVLGNECSKCHIVCYCSRIWFEAADLTSHTASLPTRKCYCRFVLQAGRALKWSWAKLKLFYIYFNIDSIKNCITRQRVYCSFNYCVCNNYNLKQIKLKECLQGSQLRAVV